MVWNTTQSALYGTERRCDKRAARTEHAEKKRVEAPKQCAQPKDRKSLFDDGDTLLLLALLYILIREKSDQTLIMALLIAMLM